MIYVALIIDGVVQNIACVDEAHFAETKAGWLLVYTDVVSIVQGSPVSAGYTYDGKGFYPPIPTPADVERARAARLATLAANTEAIRAAGFLFTGTGMDGKPLTGRFNLDHDALRQVSEALYWADRDVQMGTTNFVYPLVWPTVDRSNAVVLATHNDVVAFALAASLADRTLTASGAQIEAAICAASSVDAINAVVDNRS